MEKMLTSDEAARRLRCSLSCLYRLILSGKLRAERRGVRGRYLVPESAIGEFLVPGERPKVTPAPTASHAASMTRLREMGFRV